MLLFGNGVYLGYRNSVSKRTNQPIIYVDIRDGGYTYNFRCNCPDKLSGLQEYSKVAVVYDMGSFDNRPYLNITDISPSK